jgi:hypothetical protein
VSSGLSLFVERLRDRIAERLNAPAQPDPSTNSYIPFGDASGGEIGTAFSSPIDVVATEAPTDPDLLLPYHGGQIPAGYALTDDGESLFQVLNFHGEAPPEDLAGALAEAGAGDVASGLDPSDPYAGVFGDPEGSFLDSPVSDMWTNPENPDFVPAALAETREHNQQQALAQLGLTDEEPAADLSDGSGGTAGLTYQAPGASLGRVLLVGGLAIAGVAVLGYMLKRKPKRRRSTRRKGTKKGGR